MVVREGGAHNRGQSASEFFGGVQNLSTRMVQRGGPEKKIDAAGVEADPEEAILQLAVGNSTEYLQCAVQACETRSSKVLGVLALAGWVADRAAQDSYPGRRDISGDRDLP